MAFDIENAAIRNQLTRAQTLLVQTNADVKLVEIENIHVTMRFLGNINVDTVERIFGEIKKIQFTPFNVQLKGLGVFPSLSCPRVVWVGITDGADQLRAVFGQLEPKIRELGFAPDNKGFRPHLTIARVRSGKNKAHLAEFINKNLDFEFGFFKAECLRLKRSVLSPKGPTYSTLKEYCPEQ